MQFQTCRAQAECFKITMILLSAPKCSLYQPAACSCVRACPRARRGDMFTLKTVDFLEERQA